MLSRSHYVATDVEEVKRLVRDNPWGTFVSATGNGLVASHYPILLDEDADDLTIVSHVGRPDDEIHELGQHEILLIVAGPHGYVSPSWYPAGDFIPTWNHVTAHLYGTPELASADENYAVLDRLVDHFESRVPNPSSLSENEDLSRAVAAHTVGLRLRVTRFELRLKLSQDKQPDVRSTIMAELQGDGPYAHAALAGEMSRVPSIHESPT